MRRVQSSVDVAWTRKLVYKYARLGKKGNGENSEEAGHACCEGADYAGSGA